MCLWNTDAHDSNKVQTAYFQNKCHNQGHNVIGLGVNWKGFIS